MGGGDVRARGEMTYRYCWRNNVKRATLYGRQCRVLARLGFNSAVVEFGDGQREVVSRNALRKERDEEHFVDSTLGVTNR